MSKNEAELTAVLERARSDRLIKLFIGSTGDNRPFLIQQTTLENTSAYFKNALKHERTMGKPEERGVLRFEEDDREAWAILIFWMVKGQLPSCVLAPNEPQILLVNCWVLGDKYMILDFQNMIMLELLRVMDIVSLSVAAAEVALRGSTAHSALRDLVMEELVHAVFHIESIKNEDLDYLSSIPGFASALAEAIKGAMKRQVENPSRDFGALYKRMNHPSKRSRWMKFMVGEGPLRHWVWSSSSSDSDTASTGTVSS